MRYAVLRDLCAGSSAFPDDLLQAPPQAPRFVLVDGKLRPVPLRPPACHEFVDRRLDQMGVLRGLGWEKYSPRCRDPSPRSSEKFQLNCWTLGGPLVSNIAGDPERIQRPNAFPATLRAERGGSIVRGMLAPRKNPGKPSRDITCKLFAKANETLVARWRINSARRFLQKQVFHEFPVKMTVRSMSILESNRRRICFAQSLVLATPTNVTGKLLSALDSSFDHS